MPWEEKFIQRRKWEHLEKNKFPREWRFVCLSKLTLPLANYFPKYFKALELKHAKWVSRKLAKNWARNGLKKFKNNTYGGNDAYETEFGRNVT